MSCQTHPLCKRVRAGWNRASLWEDYTPVVAREIMHGPPQKSCICRSVHFHRYHCCAASSPGMVLPGVRNHRSNAEWTNRRSSNSRSARPRRRDRRPARLDEVVAAGNCLDPAAVRGLVRVHLHEGPNLLAQQSTPALHRRHCCCLSLPPKSSRNAP